MRSEKASDPAVLARYVPFNFGKQTYGELSKVKAARVRTLLPRGVKGLSSLFGFTTPTFDSFPK